MSYFVDVDNRQGAVMAVEHFIGLGRKHVATIAGPQDMPPGLDRLVGWQDALTAAGLELGPVDHGDFTTESGAAAMTRLLARGEPFDALFIANDQMAVGAYTALRAAGLSVPDDVAVVGFDNSYFSANAELPLTTIHQPMVEMGAEMARVLVDLMEGRPAQTATVLDGTLVVRASAQPRRRRRSPSWRRARGTVPEPEY